MAEEPNAEGEDLQPYEFTRSQLTDIGRLLRSFAEIEGALTEFIRQLAETSDLAARLMLGTAGYGTRIRVAEYFVNHPACGESAKAILAVFKDPYLDKAKLVRDALAHGALLGQRTSNNALIFVTDRQDKDPLSYSLVMSLHPDDISTAAHNAKHHLTELERLLQLESLRETRRHNTHLEHRSGQRLKDKGVAP